MIAKFKSIINRSSIGKGAFYLMGSASIGHAIGVLTFPILSRVYTPTEIGMWGMFNSLIALVVVTVNLKYEMAIITEKEDENANALFWFSVIIGMVLSLLFTGLFACLIHFHILAYERFSNSSIGIMLLCSVIIAVFQPVWTYYLRGSHYKQLGVIHLSQKIGKLSTQIGLGCCLSGYTALLYSEALGRLLSICYALPRIAGSLINSLKNLRVSQIKILLINLIDFPRYMLPATIVSVLASITAVPLVSYYFSPHDAGLYSIVYKILSLQVAILSNTMADIFYNEAAKQDRADPTEVFNLFVNTTKKIAFFSMIPFIGIELFSPFFFNIFLGKTWAGCGAIAQVLSPWLFTFTIVNSVNRIAIVINKQWAKLAYDICNFLAVCAGIILGHYLSFGLIGTLVLMSTLCASVNILFLVLFYSLVKDYSCIGASDDYSVSLIDN